MPAKRKPKPLPAIAPATVSQLTAPVVLGIDERRYLEMLVPRCARVAHVGRLRVVPIDDALAALAELAKGTAPESAAVPAAPAEEDEDLESVDAVLAALGRRRSA